MTLRSNPLKLRRPRRTVARGDGRSSPRPREAGVTLIEALVTLVVLSLGLLGMAALQVIATRENASALRHSQAIWHAYDMAERLRANLAGVEGGAYDDIDTRTLSSSPSLCGTGAPCNPQQIAAMDASQWGLRVKGLPGGLGRVTAEGGDPRRFLVQVRWQDDVADLADRRPYRASPGCPSDPSVTETCVELMIQP